MKKEFPAKPTAIREQWPGELEGFSWQDFVTAIPTPLFLVTTYKSNGTENACLQAWSTFIGDVGEFICILGSVSKRGHLYQTLQDTGCCVLNFYDRTLNDKALETIRNNSWERNEISESGLTAEKAFSVNAPRIVECFLNIECELLWMREHYVGSRDVIAVLRATHLCMDDAHYDESRHGRYGKTGYLFNINAPRNPETGEVLHIPFGAIEPFE